MNDRFTMFVTKEGQFYLARCPELPITSQGATAEAAGANLQEAIDLYLETWPST